MINKKKTYNNMNNRKIVAYCGSKWSGCTFSDPFSGNVENILNDWHSATGTSQNRPRNETDADAFIINQDIEDGKVIRSELHVFKTNCSPKMICTYNGAGKIISNNNNIWKKKIYSRGSNSATTIVMADYNKFSDANIRIGSYGNSEAYSGFSSPSKIEYSFINGNDDENDIPEATNEGMFSGVPALTSCDIPCQMRTISSNTFKGCAKLADYTNPDWFDTIGVSAFEGCTSLQTIKIGRPTKISARSFANCINAFRIDWCKLKKSSTSCMKDIPSHAFDNCTNLKYTKFSGETDSNAIIIPKGISGISEYAFSKCSRIQNLDLNEVKKIGDHAFEYCTTLRSITGMSGVTSVGEYAFNLSGNTWSASSIGDLSQIKTIGKGAFSYVKFDRGISLSTSSPLSVGDEAFYYAKVNGDVTVPSSLSGIPYKCFYGLTTTGKVSISSQTINIEAFAYATFGDKDLDLTNVHEIACQAFYNSNVENAVFRSNVVLGDSSCGYGSFESCDDLRTVTFNGSATIGKKSFYGCNSLQDINIEGSGVTVSRYRDSFDESGPVVHLNGYTKGSTAPADYLPWVKYYEDNNWKSLQIVDSAGEELYAAGRG